MAAQWVRLAGVAVALAALARGDEAALDTALSADGDCKASLGATECSLHMLQTRRVRVLQAATAASGQGAEDHDALPPGARAEGRGVGTERPGDTDEGLQLLDVAAVLTESGDAASSQASGFQIAQLWKECRTPWKEQPHKVDALASGTHRFVYVDNVKAGSTSIRRVLGRYVFGGDIWARNTDMPHRGRTGGDDAQGKRLSTDDFESEAVKGAFKFSFIRDPVAKFESGVREAWAQHPELRPYTADQLLDMQLNSSRWLNEHLQPSSYRLCGFNAGAPLDLDFVGKLEDIKQSWTRAVDSMDALSAEVSSAMKRSLGKENVHKHDQRSRLSAAAVARMCRSEMYDADWRCFGYELPEACQAA